MSDNETSYSVDEIAGSGDPGRTGRHAVYSAIRLGRLPHYTDRASSKIMVKASDWEAYKRGVK